MRLTLSAQRAPDTAHGTEPVPGLADLNAIARRPNTLEAGEPIMVAPNFGQTSTMQPPNGFRSSPQLDLAAGPAPRDTHLPTYIVTPAPPASRYDLVPSVDVAEAQANALQVTAAGPVGYVPAGVASLEVRSS